MAVWDPATYLQFADERSRPFFDLVHQIKSMSPASVVDLGVPGPTSRRSSLSVGPRRASSASTPHRR